MRGSVNPKPNSHRQKNVLWSVRRISNKILEVKGLNIYTIHLSPSIPGVTNMKNLLTTSIHCSHRENITLGDNAH